MRKRWPLVGLVVVSAGLGLLWPDAEVSVETETSAPVAARSQLPDREVLVAPSASVIGTVDGASSPGRFEGHVVDEDDVPLPGAELTFSKDGDRKRTRADAQGHFSFEAADGEWRVERVWAPGHLAKEDEATSFAAAGTVVRGLRFVTSAFLVVPGTPRSSEALRELGVR